MVRDRGLKSGASIEGRPAFNTISLKYLTGKYEKRPDADAQGTNQLL